MKQLTAVEWLVEKFNQCEPMFSGIQSLEHKQYLDSLIEQAKAMEKEQIIDALFFGIHLENNKIDSPLIRAEQYYSETYEPFSK